MRDIFNCVDNNNRPKFFLTEQLTNQCSKIFKTNFDILGKNFELKFTIDHY